VAGPDPFYVDRCTRWYYNVYTLFLEAVMIKRLVVHGNSAALIIDKPILELLKMDLDTPLEISTDGRSLIISPASAARRERKFRAAVKKVNQTHGRSLEKLSR
jgi:antitoxin MazE